MGFILNPYRFGVVYTHWIEIRTTSTSAAWSPTALTKTGDVLHWEVTGAVTTSADVNKPTFDFSPVGTKNVIVYSSDGFSELTTFRFTGGAATAQYIDFTNGTDLKNIWLFSTFTTVIGLELLTNLSGDCRIYSNSGLIMALDISDISLMTSWTSLYGNRFTSIDVTGRTNITSLLIYLNLEITEVIGQNDLTGMTNYNCNSNKLTSLPPNSTLLTSLSCSNNLLATIDLSPYTLLTSLVCGGNTATTFDTTYAPNLKTINCGGAPYNLTVSCINQMIIDQDAKGLSSGNINWTGYAPTRTETTTDDVWDAYNNLLGRSYTLTGAAPV